MKLVIEVIDAHDLMPKDCEGSANSFVEIVFGDQRSRTQTIPKTLNPTWNQILIFDFYETHNHSQQTIEVYVYNDRKPVCCRNFLGKVRIPCSKIVKKGDEAYQRFPLEKKWLLSSVKGEIGLKVYLSATTPVLENRGELPVVDTHKTETTETKVKTTPAVSTIERFTPKEVEEDSLKEEKR